MRTWLNRLKKGGLLACMSMISTVLVGLSANASVAFTCSELFYAASTALAPTVSLKERSIQIGYAHGLSRESVENLLLKLVDSGKLGGAEHVRALLRDEGGGQEVMVHNPIGYQGYVKEYSTKVFAKSDFRKLKSKYESRADRSNESLRLQKVKSMAKGNYDLGPAEQTILAMWYLETLDVVLNEAVKNARNDSTRFALRIPYLAREVSIRSAVGGIAFGTGAYLLGYETIAMAALPIIAKLAGAGMVYPLADRIGLGRLFSPNPSGTGSKLSKRFQKAVSKDATLKLEDQRTRIKPPDLEAFNPRDPFQSFTIPLRAEVARVGMESDLLFDLGETRHVILANYVKPLVDLSIATSKVQIARFDQIISWLERLSADKTPSHTVSDLNELRSHIKRLSEDISYTEKKMAQLHRLFENALANSMQITKKELGDITYFNNQLEKYAPTLAADLTSRRERSRQLLFSLQGKWL